MVQKKTKTKKNPKKQPISYFWKSVAFTFVHLFFQENLLLISWPDRRSYCLWVLCAAGVFSSPRWTCSCLWDNGLVHVYLHVLCSRSKSHVNAICSVARSWKSFFTTAFLSCLNVLQSCSPPPHLSSSREQSNKTKNHFIMYHHPPLSPEKLWKKVGVD